MTDNLSAFLTMIAVSELGQALIDDPITDRGYRVIVGSTAAEPHVFMSYADHPRTLVWLPRINVSSTAAGRYQILARIYDHYKTALHLNDFSPDSQDKIAVQLIRERHALPMIAEGDFAGAVNACSSCWASLPGAVYGQHVNRLEDLRTAYSLAGGKTLAA